MGSQNSTCVFFFVLTVLASFTVHAVRNYVASANLSDDRMSSTDTGLRHLGLGPITLELHFTKTMNQSSDRIQYPHIVEQPQYEKVI